jgi:hypothetical protein
MKSNISIACCLSLFYFTACNKVYKQNTTVVQSNITNVPYTEAKQYFVKNTYKVGSLKNPKITTREDFELIFGTAATMGSDGLPTAIDFSKQYVIAIIPNSSFKQTTLTVNSLVKDNREIKLYYKLSEGDLQSFESQLCLVLIIDNFHDGIVKLYKN